MMEIKLKKANIFLVCQEESLSTLIIRIKYLKKEEEEKNLKEFSPKNFASHFLRLD